MENVWKSDFYRLRKSKLLYGIAVFTSMIAFFLVTIIGQDIRLGVSIFGDLIAFRGLEDIVRIGIKYNKGLGILVAILIAVFIGQEYQWNTWQHKWIISKSRTEIYLSKALLSSIASVVIFLLFEIITLLGSGQISALITAQYAAAMFCGIFLYMTLGSVICMFSMLIKNSTSSVIVCLGYILMSETLVSIIKNISGFSTSFAKVVEWIMGHTIYGMSTIIASTSFSTDLIVPILVNSIVIMILSTMIGLCVFRKCEL